MGMIFHILRASEEQLQAYLADSATLEARIYGAEDDPEAAPVDLDKSWDGILFLLTGHGISNADGPLLRVLFSSQLIDDEQDLGCGPAHYLMPDEVAELNGQIAGISVDDLKQRYDPDEMDRQEVYPMVWIEEGEEAFEYLVPYYSELQGIFSQAAARGEAIITYLS